MASVHLDRRQQRIANGSGILARRFFLFDPQADQIAGRLDRSFHALAVRGNPKARDMRLVKPGHLFRLLHRFEQYAVSHGITVPLNFRIVDADSNQTTTVPPRRGSQPTSPAGSS